MIVKSMIIVNLLWGLSVPMQLPTNYHSDELQTSIPKSREHSILLQGEITNQRLEKRDREDFYRLILPTKLSLINDQPLPVILIKDAIQIVGVRIAATESNLKLGSYIHDSSSLPSFKNETLKSLTVPTADAVEIVLPKGRYDWAEEYWISLNAESSDSSFSRSLSLKDLEISKANRNSVWIELDIAFFPMNSMPTEGENLRLNWRDHGRLLLETVTTLPIEMSIPASVTFHKEDY